jgi:hypothetical protein
MAFRAPSLTDTVFSTLEKSGRRPLSGEVRLFLKTGLLRLQRRRPHWFEERANKTPKTKKSKLLLGIARDSGRLKDKLNQFLSMPAHNTLMSPSIGDIESIVLLLEGLEERSRWASGLQLRIEPHLREQPGPKVSEWYVAFFFLVADAYEMAGGRVSAAFQRDKGRNSPFMRFFSEMHCLLSRAQQILGPNDKGEWANKTAIPRWKRARQG